MHVRTATESQLPTEHALLVLEARTIPARGAGAAADRLAGAGLRIIAHAERRLAPEDVHASFKYTAPEYVADVDGCCHATPCSRPARMRQSRRSASATNCATSLAATRADIYNVLHMSDTGWEFVKQFTLFFPDRPLTQYAGYADLLPHPPAARSPTLLEGSSIGLLELVDGSVEQIDAVRAAGAEAIAILRRRVRDVASPRRFASRRGEVDTRSAESFLDWVHERHGLVFFDDNDDRLPAWPMPADAVASARLTPVVLDAYRRQIEPFRRLQLDGLVVIHPRRHAFVLEAVWELSDEDPLLQLGGRPA